MSQPPPYITQLFHDLSLNEAPLADARGEYIVSFGKRMDVAIKFAGDSIVFLSLLGPWQGKNNEELLQTLMHANFLGDGTGGGVIGMLEDESALTFSRHFQTGLSYSQFKDELENFINYLELWQGKVQDALQT